MKKRIHPEYKNNRNMHAEIVLKQVQRKHPCRNLFRMSSILYRKQKFVDQGGRVDRFKKKYGLE